MSCHLLFGTNGKHIFRGKNMLALFWKPFRVFLWKIQKIGHVASLAIDDKESCCEKPNSSDTFPSSHIYKFIHIYKSSHILLNILMYLQILKYLQIHINSAEYPYITTISDVFGIELIEEFWRTEIFEKGYKFTTKSLLWRPRRWNNTSSRSS